MARTLLTPTVVDRTGTVANPATANGDNVNGNNFLNNGRVLLRVNNTAGVSGTVTVEIPAGNAPDGSTLTNSGRQYTIAAAGDVLIGPFPAAIYNQADGSVFVDTSASTMKLALITLN